MPLGISRSVVRITEAVGSLLDSLIYYRSTVYQKVSISPIGTRMTRTAVRDGARSAGMFDIRYPVGDGVHDVPSVEITVILNRLYPQGGIPPWAPPLF